MPDLFSTNSLVGVIEDLPEPDAFLLDLLFTNQLFDESEEIHFDVDQSKPRLTPFVSPLIAGKVVTQRGFTTKTFKPAYAKDLRIFRPQDALKRAKGEKIGGSLSAEQRMKLRLGQELQDQIEMLTRREIVMAGEALRTGKVTVSGEGFPTQVVDFGRDAALTFALTANDRWTVDHADSDPLGDIEAWGTLLQQKGFSMLEHIIMDPVAWSNFRKRLVTRNEWEMMFNGLRSSVNSEMNFAPNNGKIARRVGTLDAGGPTVWVYQDLYIDDAGVEQKMLPDNTVIGASTRVEGTRCYAAIQDEEAGIKAMRYFPKSWLEKNPGVRHLLLQSAPLVVPFRPNATICVTVHS